MKREQIEQRYKWRLEDIIPSDEVWEEEFAKLAKYGDELAAFDGALKDRDSVLRCLKLDDEASLCAERIYVFSAMRRDENVGDPAAQKRCDRAETAMVRLSERTSFVTPQLIALGEAKLAEFAADPDFKDYDYMLRSLIRTARHTLSPSEEKLLAMTGSFADTAQDAFRMLDNADIKFAPYVDSTGEEVRLTHGIYGVKMHSPVREDRKKAFECMHGAFKDNVNTIAALYSGNVKKDLFYSRARKYASCLDRATSREDVPRTVYDRLVECVEKNIPLLSRYLELRRNRLGLDELHMYDLHVPIVEDAELRLEYEDACKLVKQGLAPLGEEYGKLLDRAFTEGWIDVCENEGKRSGAYSWGAYGTHPYVLLNYQKTTSEIFTIAHELGHAMHSYHSDGAQPYPKAGYTIFVAEIASTVNETLMLHHLLEKYGDDKAMREYLLSYMLDMFRTTVFRQTQFAQFELAAHELAERDEPLSAETFCDLYYDLNRKYYAGEHVVNDELIRYEWSRIPHFYTSFYVYKYATGLISAVCIADRILKEGKPAVEDYKKFLSAGGSMPPVEIIKLAGVDLTSSEPFDKAMGVFADFLARLEG